MLIQSVGCTLRSDNGGTGHLQVSRMHMSVFDHRWYTITRGLVYLLNYVIHEAATALDPRVKLSFADQHREGKVFVFPSRDVKLPIKSLLPPDPQPIPVTTSNHNAVISEVQPPI